MNNFGTSSVEKILKPVKMNMNATPSATDDIGQCRTRWACARVYAQPRGSHASTRHAFLLDGSAGCTNDSTPATVAKLTLLSAAQGAAEQHPPHRVVATNVQATGDVMTCIAVSGSTSASCWTNFAMIDMLDTPMLARAGRANGLEIRLAVVATDVLMTTLIDYQRLQKRARGRHVHVCSAS